MKEKNSTPLNDDYKIDDSQFDVDKSQYEGASKDEKQEQVSEETEVVPVDEKFETIHFPWFIAIIMGVLMVLIIACIIVIKVLEG